MNRRNFLKQFSLVSLLPFLPRLQSQTWTFGAWLLPVGADPLSYPCLEFSLQTGTQAQRDAFFAGLTGFLHRGFYGFSYPRLLTNEEVTAIRNLFEEKCDTRFPIIQKES